MLNFIKKIFGFSLKSTSVATDTSAPPTVSLLKDELIGLWENDLDDGSGLHAIWGWSLQFNEDGTGIKYYWDNQERDKFPFLWLRISENLIKAKYVYEDSDDDSWDTIEYTKVIVDAPYSGKLIKLTDSNYKSIEGEEGFWDGYGAVFKAL